MTERRTHEAQTAEPTHPMRPASPHVHALLPVLLCGLVAGCALDPPVAPAARCSVLSDDGQPPTVSDTVDVVVQLLVPGPVDLLVRVDPTTEDGIVDLPGDAPPGTAAAGLALSTDGLYSICLSANPEEIVFQSEVAPVGRAWLRVATDRPVRARLQLGGLGRPFMEPDLVVEPGSSGRARWTDPEAEG